MENILSCRDLVVSVSGRVLVHNLSVAVEPGTMICILGRNGVGKTLTLHTLAGLRAEPGCHVDLDGAPLTNFGRRQIARRIGLLLQMHEDKFPVTVIESVLMGCHPRLGFWQRETDQDRLAAGDALTCFGLSGLEQRIVSTLSGGERRRLALATLMVQDPDIWLLDEPTNHLDPHHQLEVLETLAGLARDGRSIVASLHDPVLAARYCDFALMLHGDGAWEFGPVGELLNEHGLERLYRTPFERFDGASRSVMLPA